MKIDWIQDLLVSIAAAESRSPESAPEHPEENEYDQTCNEPEDKYGEQPRGRAEKIERGLILRVVIPYRLLLDSVEEGGSNFVPFMQDGDSHSPENCGHAKAEETANGS